MASLGLNDCLHSSRHAFVERSQVCGNDLSPDFLSDFFIPSFDVARSSHCHGWVVVLAAVVVVVMMAVVAVVMVSLGITLCLQIVRLSCLL